MPPDQTGITLAEVGNNPKGVEFDGTDLWVASINGHTVQRLRPSDGEVLQTWTGAEDASSIVVARGRIFVTGSISPGNGPGRIYFIDPTQSPGDVSLLIGTLPGPNAPTGIAFDGARLWTSNGIAGSISIVSLNPAVATTIATGFTTPSGILYDGSHIWVTDEGADKLFKLDSNGNILQTINVGNSPQHTVFDGMNIWVSNFLGNSITVVRVKDSNGNALASAFVLTTLTGNGLSGPKTAAFDGERILVTNFNGDSISLYKAADLSPLGSISTGSSGTQEPFGACSDGMNFWVTYRVTDKLARF
jgi:outer membrane protein assembly factor BamB